MGERLVNDRLGGGKRQFSHFSVLLLP
jgi:hypothetical protein